jgi:adenosylmethionine---8-amino-7-oxononanoate aminotransferase
MMRKTHELQELDKRYVWHPFTPMRLWLDGDPLVIDRGEGVYLYDTDGNRYIDGVSSLWCNVHGHNHPHINAAIRSQLDKIAHSTFLGLTHEPAIRLAEQLSKITPPGLQRFFYSDNGATAVEIALKIAFQYWRNIRRPKTKFIALKQSYHGDTLGAVGVGGIEIFHYLFGPLTVAALFTPSPHPYRFDGPAYQCRDDCLDQLRRLLEQHHQEVAAIVIEPLIQGAAGMIVHPPGFLSGVRKLADEFDVLMIADEVAVGFGRTGTMFACPQEEVAPDILCMAKGLTGGCLPLAATVVTEKIFEAFLAEPWQETTFYHGHTYTANPLGCAAALANLEVFEQENTIANLPDKIALIRQYLLVFARLPYVGDVRLRGMMAGIELVEKKKSRINFDPRRRIGAAFCQSLRSQGLIVRPLGDVIVLMPPLSISLDILEEMLRIIHDGLRQLTGLITL